MNTHIASEAIQDMIPTIEALGVHWSESPRRPRLDRDILELWDDLIKNWVRSDLPLVLRKASEGRGSKKIHNSGRVLTFSDNSLANWVFQEAWERRVPSLSLLSTMFENRELPLAMILKSREKECCVYSRPGLRKGLRPNAEGWKLCHIEGVALQGRGDVTERPMNQIIEHFIRFVSPRNMFLMPLELGGIGEVPQFIEKILTFEQEQMKSP